MDEEVNRFISNKITHIGNNSRLKDIFRLIPFTPFHFTVSRVKNSSLAYNCNIELLVFLLAAGITIDWPIFFCLRKIESEHSILTYFSFCSNRSK